MFKPYRGNDVRGHVKIRGVWMHANPALPENDPNLPGAILITRRGWGETSAGVLSDFTPEEQALLRTTLEDEPRPTGAQEERMALFLTLTQIDVGTNDGPKIDINMELVFSIERRKNATVLSTQGSVDGTSRYVKELPEDIHRMIAEARLPI